MTTLLPRASTFFKVYNFAPSSFARALYARLHDFSHKSSKFKVTFSEMHTSESADDKHQCVAILKALEAAMLDANSFPNAQELDVLHVTNSQHHDKAKHINKRLVAIIRAVASRYAVTNRTTDSDSASSNSTTSISPRDHLHDEVFETTDETLECFNAALDSARGIKHAIVPPTASLGPNPASLKIGLGYLGKRHGGFLDIEKPQIHFPDYPIDNSHNPFVPPYTHGSSQDTIVAEATNQHVDRHLQDLFRNNSNHDGERRHPYDEEIAAAATEMAKRTFAEENTTVYASVEETPCVMVTTEEELFNIAERLKRVSEVAVDLENHSIRSFQGFTCLLQVSTRREDFVIDTLKLRGSIHRALAPVFTDETIVKVLHGADKDIQWLERDFGIYVVNMFDTGQAARLLKLPSAALSFLLAKYCDVTATNKRKFQLADWRQRPLPKEMFDYARSDTHYLLYVYDRVRSELSKVDLMAEAWERAAKISRKRHSKTRYDAYMARSLAAKHGLGFDRHQIRLLEALCRWRDQIAREEDESLVYVTPLHTLFGIVRARDKARTVPGLMNHGFPMRHVPPLIYRNAETITRLVSDALDAKLEEGCNNRPAGINASNNGKRMQEEQKRESPKREALPQEISKISIPDEGSQEVQICVVATEKKSSESTILPDAKLRTLSKCAFFDSDSESDSCSGEVVLCERIGEDSKPHSKGKDIGKITENFPGVKLTKEGADSYEDGQVKGSKAGTVQREDVTKTESVFELSDESESEEEADSGKMKAAQVAQELEAELADNVKKLKSVEFETELDARKREHEELARTERELEEERMEKEAKTERQEELVSILEAARRNEGDSMGGRRRKRTREASVETKRLDPFDYSAAHVVKDLKLENDSRLTKQNFDPMDGLKGRRGMAGRSSARRRRRGRGKSMSFRS